MNYDKISEYFLNGVVCQYEIPFPACSDPSLVQLKNAYLSSPILKGADPTWLQPAGAVYDNNNKLVELSRMREQQELPQEIIRSEDANILSGKHIYLGYYNQVYGHFILETLSRMWALEDLDLSEYRLLFHSMHLSLIHI